ncbi:hypothetical protein STSO111631_20230 [Stackebrandtia soli]
MTSTSICLDCHGHRLRTVDAETRAKCCDTCKGRGYVPFTKARERWPRPEHPPPRPD